MIPSQFCLTDPAYQSALARFIPKLRFEGDCWMWTGKTLFGYAHFHLGKWNKPIETRGHRAAYRMFKGDIPSGMVVMHSCDHPGCVNPAHLTLGTTQENQQDSIRKGRSINGSSSHYAKVSEQDVIAIRQRRERGEKLKSIGRDYGLSESGVHYIVTRKKWKHI